MFRLKRTEWAVILVIVVVLLALLPGGEWGHRRFKRCILCRVVHVKHDYCGFSWEDERENICTEWYRQNVAASHDHLWVGCSTPYSTQNLFGQNIGCASNLDYRPAEALTSEQQVGVYEHIGNLAEARQLFVDLHDHVIARNVKGKWIASYLLMWAEEDGFKTPWPEWKQRMNHDIEESLEEADVNDEEHDGAKKID